MNQKVEEIILRHMYKSTAAKYFGVNESSYLYKGFMEAAKAATKEIVETLTQEDE